MAEFTQTITVDCPHCKSPQVVRAGKRNGYQRYRCKGCKRDFNTLGNAFGSWNKAEHIALAIDAYHSGMSYKQIAELLERNFDIPEPSKHTIHRWVKEYSVLAGDIVSAHSPQTSDHWVADEMQLKVGGQRMWNWNVMDRDTRYILAVHLSPYRDEKQAIAVMEKALKNNGGVIPETITTDGLGSYGMAIALTLPPPSTRHIIADGIYEEVNNNLSERLQGTFRDRTKTMRGHQTQKTGQRHLDGFAIDYNHFRDHHAHRGETPGHIAKMDTGLKNWVNVVNAVSEFKAMSNPHKRKAEERLVGSGGKRNGQKKASRKRDRGWAGIRY
jgi:transposase-like protein